MFGYRRYDDLISAKKLNSKIGNKYPLSEIKKTIKNPKISSKNTPYGKGDASSKIIRIMQKRF